MDSSRIVVPVTESSTKRSHDVTVCENESHFPACKRSRHHEAVKLRNRGRTAEYELKRQNTNRARLRHDKQSLARPAQVLANAAMSDFLLLFIRCRFRAFGTYKGAKKLVY
jgi:hypothetical protein